MKAEIADVAPPRKASLLRRSAYGVLTVMAWLAWALLWLPVLHVLAWHMDIPWRWLRWMPPLVLSGTRELAHILWVAPLCLAVFVAWSLWESRHRRRERRRRRAAPRVTVPAAAAALGASPGTAHRLQATRRAVVRVDDDGHIAMAPTRR